MKKHILKTTSHPLISGSAVIFLGSILSSFFNFLFNLFMTRNLSVVDYGTVASVLSTTTLFGLISGSFVPTIIRFTGQYFAINDLASVKGVYKRIFMISLFFGICTLLFFTFYSKQLADFFHIEQAYLLPLVGLMSFFSYLLLVNTTLIQAKLSFRYLSFVNLLAAVSRLGTGIFFVLLGFGVLGVLWANLLSTIVQYMASFLPLMFLFKHYQSKSIIGVKEVIRYGIPTSLCMFVLTSFVTTDIILVKHFFSPHEAGLYSGISLIGRVIFFFTAPIGTAMFPMVIQRRTRQENYRAIFELALLLVFLSSIVISLFYYLFPDFTITFFIKNSQYLSLSPLLGLFGLFISLYAVLYIVIHYFLSIEKKKIVYPVCIGGVLQILLIVLFHKDFFQVLVVSISVISLLLLYLLLYYLKSERYEKSK